MCVCVFFISRAGTRPPGPHQDVWRPAAGCLASIFFVDSEWNGFSPPPLLLEYMGAFWGGVERFHFSFWKKSPFSKWTLFFIMWIAFLSSHPKWSFCWVQFFAFDALFVLYINEALIFFEFSQKENPLFSLNVLGFCKIMTPNKS